MSILEKREEIIENNNTAQKQLLDILDNYSRHETTLYIREPLHGDIDLLPLREELGFNLINSIHFSKGQITNISNIPKGIVSLNCDDNLLTSLLNLPSTLEFISVHNNLISDINIFELKKLTNLNISHNKITQLEYLPSSLVELNCESNDLYTLDCSNLINLKILNVSNNKITVIDNLPENLDIFKYDNNPSIEFRNSDINIITAGNKEVVEKNTNYKEALNEYFRLKDQYEKGILEAKRRIYNNANNTKKLAKRLASQYKPKCINCKREVGTIFKKQDSKYLAICGDNNTPCSLDIKIFTSEYNQFMWLFDFFKGEFDKVKDSIIRQKLDTLFNYITEEESVSLFKDKITEYNDDNQLYNQYIEDYNNLYHNKETSKRISELQIELFNYIERSKDLIREYKKTNNHEFLKSAIDLQIKDIAPTSIQIRTLKHKIMEIIKIQDPNKMFPTNHLFQYPLLLNDIEYGSAEQPRVIKYNI
tara:strand:+ start:3070 stop:4503 length:1434 start_codon:yes stop_codon:yes gene_type:complete